MTIYKNKMNSMRKKVWGAALVALVMCLSLVGCSKSAEKSVKGKSKSKETEEQVSIKVDVSSCAYIHFEGYEGMGVARCSTDNSVVGLIKNDVAKELSQGGANNYKNDFSPFFESLTYLITPSTDLKNGDEVTVTISYDESLAKKYGFVVKGTEVKKTVSGLQAIQTVDPFEGLAVTFSGSEEEATVVINNSGCSDFVRNFVTYVYDSNGVYSNGDTLTVDAIWGDNFTADDRDVYVFTTDSKEYEISGLNYFPKTKDGLDFIMTGIALKDYATGVVTNYLYNEIHNYATPSFNDISFNPHENDYSNMSIVCVKEYFAQAKENVDKHARFLMLFHVTYDLSSPDGTKSTHVDTYIAGYSSEFYADASGAIVNTGTMNIVNGSRREDLRYLRFDMSFDNAYNSFIASQMTDFVVDEIKSA